MWKSGESKDGIAGDMASPPLLCAGTLCPVGRECAAHVPKTPVWCRNRAQIASRSVFPMSW